MKKLSVLIGLLPLCTLLSGIPSLAEEAPAPIRVTALKGPTAMGLVSFMDQADQGAFADSSYDFQILGSVDEVSPMLVQGSQPIWPLSFTITQKELSRCWLSIPWGYSTW